MKIQKFSSFSFLSVSPLSLKKIKKSKISKKVVRNNTGERLSYLGIFLDSENENSLLT